MDRNEQLFTFIEESPTPYHVVRTISRTLLEEGFQELKEQESWKLEAGGSYYVSRNGSSLIAFRIPEQRPEGSGSWQDIVILPALSLRSIRK